MTPLELMETPVQEETESPAPVRINPVESCFNAAEDYMSGVISGEKMREILARHSFTQDSLNDHYFRTANYESVFKTVDNQDF